MTPGEYLALRRGAAGLTLAQVAARLQTEPRLDERGRLQLLGQIESSAVPANAFTLAALRACFRFDSVVYDALADRHFGRFAALPPAPRICIGCGCTEHDACRHGFGACHWVAADRCSACGGAPASASIGAQAA